MNFKMLVILAFFFALCPKLCNNNNNKQTNNNKNTNNSTVIKMTNVYESLLFILYTAMLPVEERLPM
jgi:hypothetical protein